MARHIVVDDGESVLIARQSTTSGAYFFVASVEAYGTDDAALDREELVTMAAAAAATLDANFYMNFAPDRGRALPEGERAADEEIEVPQPPPFARTYD